MIKINLSNQLYQGVYGSYLKEILSFYVPLLLQIPKLRDDPSYMKETIKAVGNSGITDVATQADIYVQQEIKKEVTLLHQDWQFWGEEGDDNINEYDISKKFLFITDPIEGTNNFRYKKDNYWGSVVALVDIVSKNQSLVL